MNATSHISSDSVSAITAVHAYLHRKEGQLANSDYWYQRAGREFYRPVLADEWQTLAAALLSSAK